MRVCHTCDSENPSLESTCRNCGSILVSRKRSASYINDIYRIEHLLYKVPGGWLYNGQDVYSGKIVKIKEYLNCADVLPEILEKTAYRKNILKSLGIIDFVDCDNDLFIILEASDNISLEEKKQRRDGRAFSYEEVIPWFRSMLSFVHYFHEHKFPLVFGDLNPGSFAVFKDDIVLRDPGLCFLLFRKESIMKYSCTFSAPETRLHGDMTIQSDIYSIAAIIFYLLTDSPDKEGTRTFFDPSNSTKLAYKIPIEFERLLFEMIHPNPSERFLSLDKILRLLDKIQKRDNPSESHLTRGIAAFNQKNYDKALTEFKRASLLDLNWATPYFWQGISFLEKQDYTRASKVFDRAISLDSSYQAAYYQRGVAYMKLGLLRNGEEDFTKAIQLNKKDSRAYFSRGTIYKLQEKYQLAEKDFTKAIEFDPHNSEIYLQRAYCRYENGKIDDSMKDYEKATAIDPENPTGYLGKGLSLSIKGDKGLALDNFDKSIELNPKYAEAFVERGILLIELLDLEKALEDLDKAIILSPENIEAYFYRGKIYTISKNYRKADVDLTKFIEYFPEVLEAYVMRGEARRKIGNIQGALQDEKKAATLRNKNSDFRNKK